MPITENKSIVDREIERLFDKLQTITPESEEYAPVQERMIKLYKMRAEIEIQQPRVSQDTLVLAATNLIGIFLILNHERLNVITTKANALALKPR